jgi:Fe-S-cluster containining protein
MKRNDLTFVYFIEDSNQEKMIYLKHNKDDSNFLLIFSEIKPKLFNKNIYLTDKKIFNDIIVDIFSEIKTSYFFYLKPEEQIPFIPYNENFDKQYYFVNIKYLFENTYFLRSEIRIYNKSKILSDGLDNIDIQNCFKNINISNYHYFYSDIEKRCLKKSLNLINNSKYNSEIVFYLTDYNLRTFYNYNIKHSKNNIFKDKIYYLLDLKKLLEIQNHFNSKTSEYLSISINIVLFYLNNSNNIEAQELINELKKEFFNNITIIFLQALILKSEEKYPESINCFNDILKIKDNIFFDYKNKCISTPESWINYESFYQKGLIYKKTGDIKNAIYEFEQCLNFTNDKNIIEEITKFLDTHKEKIIETNFNCESCGNCCRYKSVNITHNDVQNILDNRPDIKVEDFVEFIVSNNNNHHHVDKINIKDNKNLMILKKKESILECVFLDNNKCLINEYKPLVCKTWPFVIRESDKKLMWGLNEIDFINDYCKHTLVNNNSNISILEKNINDFKKDRVKFIETVYNWNNLNKNENISFLDFSLKFSNKNTINLEKILKEKLKHLFIKDSNISLLEYKPFISEYFVNTLNNFSFAIHIKSSIVDYFNKEYLEQIKKELNAKFYNIYNIPNIYSSYFIENKDIKYTINLYFYSFTDDIIISNNSDIIFENNNLKIITKDESKMLEYEIDKLIKSMDNLSKYILENFKKDSSLKNLDLINNILFSLVSLLNKDIFELLKHNKYEFMNNNFNNFLLSDFYFIKEEKDLIKHLKKAKELLLSLIEKYRKYNLNLTYSKD